MLTTLAFCVLAFLAIFTALLTIALANPVTCALSLIVCLMSVAGLFAQLSAGYLAVLQVLIYAGAIMVLFLFVVMLLNLSAEEAEEGAYPAARRLTVLACVAFLVDLLIFMDLAVGHRIFMEGFSGWGGLAQIGELLFTRYIVPFEVTSLLLTAAVVGVVLMTRQHKAVPEE